MPSALVINQYFAADKKAIEQLEADKEAIAAQLTEMKEGHFAEDGYFADYDKVNIHPKKSGQAPNKAHKRFNAE